MNFNMGPGKEKLGVNAILSDNIKKIRICFRKAKKPQRYL